MKQAAIAKKKAFFFKSFEFDKKKIKIFFNFLN